MILLMYNFISFPNNPWFFTCLQYKSFEKNFVGKGKIVVTSNFSFSNSVFYPFCELPDIYVKFENVICKLSLEEFNFFVWERVNFVFYSLTICRISFLFFKSIGFKQLMTYTASLTKIQRTIADFIPYTRKD